MAVNTGSPQPHHTEARLSERARAQDEMRKIKARRVENVVRHRKGMRALGCTPSTEPLEHVALNGKPSLGATYFGWACPSVEAVA